MYIDGSPFFGRPDRMKRASLIYAGGEFNEPRSDCINAGFGLFADDLPWQRATQRGFREAFTIRSARARNDHNKWRIGDVPNGFRISNFACGA